jgi:hypothetical protein
MVHKFRIKHFLIFQFQNKYSHPFFKTTQKEFHFGGPSVFFIKKATSCFGSGFWWV